MIFCVATYFNPRYVSSTNKEGKGERKRASPRKKDAHHLMQMKANWRICIMSRNQHFQLALATRERPWIMIQNDTVGTLDRHIFLNETRILIFNTSYFRHMSAQGARFPVYRNPARGWTGATLTGSITISTEGIVARRAAYIFRRLLIV